ncbi:MAG: hypothetical protein KDA21_07340 [Phycisphaerales bacterium]|nr:hypothetical protein [Phycisphaerales bacterium]
MSQGAVSVGGDVLVTPLVASPWEGKTPLGVTVGGNSSRFAVVAAADAVRLRLVHPGTRECHTAALSPVDGEPEVWSVEVSGDRRGWTYVYEIDRDGVTLSDIVDPRATLVRESRAMVCTDRTHVTPRPPLEPRDAVIYELHVRDFTRDAAAGIRTSWNGRYLGLTQTGTRLAGTELSTGLDHLVELGVTVIQIMPVHSFASLYDRAYEWGYMPNEYFAPFEGYASSVAPEAPVQEFKRAVAALHEAGLRVTLDVVFNHTSEKWPTRLRGLMALAPHTYFRFKDDGTPWDGSACGNEFRSESDHGRRLIVESCLHWVQEYGVDGFRFDLMGLIDRDTMELVTTELHAIDPTLLVYGEPWAAGPTPIEVNEKGVQRGRGWGVFNDILRDGLRGSVFDEDDPGFLVSGEKIPRVKDGIMGAIRSFADGPLESVNYIECHDNHTLADRLELTVGEHKLTELQKEQMHRLGLLILMTCPGIPFIHAGQEFDRSKDGHDNTYNLGDEINNIAWAAKDQRHRLFAFYQRVIRMRLDHPIFRRATREDVERGVHFFDESVGIETPVGAIGVLLEDVTGEDAWKRVVLLFNGTDAEVQMNLPEGDWHVVVDNCHIPARDAAIRQRCRVAGHSGTVLSERRV